MIVLTYLSPFCVWWGGPEGVVQGRAIFEANPWPLVATVAP